MSARNDILQRIRDANQTNCTEEQAAKAWESLPRNYNVASRDASATLLDLFEERLRDYDATVVRCTVPQIADAVGQILTQRNKEPLLIPAGLPPEWLPQTFTFVEDNRFDATELDGFEGVLTAASLAIAETGTIVLQNVPGQGRRAVSLVPDYHLCIVRATNVVGTVPEAMAQLAATQSLATTFVSGPSATADIEMTRIKGVHGPRTLDVLLAI